MIRGLKEQLRAAEQMHSDRRLEGTPSQQSELSFLAAAANLSMNSDLGAVVTKNGNTAKIDKK